MAEDNTSKFSTAFTVSVDARKGTTTGISAQDRSETVRVAIDPKTKPEDLLRPGHIFPLRAKHGGVLVRTGQTEGSTDLARLAGLAPAAVICEIMNEDGTMARMPALRRFSKRHGIPIVAVADIVAQRLQKESLVREVASSRLPSKYDSEFKIRVFECQINQYLHVALVKGTIRPDTPTLVRVHSECFTGEVLGSLRCDCREQLEKALQLISEADSGVLLYIRQEGRGIGFVNKIRAYAMQDRGHDTVTANEKLGFAADLRDYGVGAQILKAVGVQKMRLLTNKPAQNRGPGGLWARGDRTRTDPNPPNTNNLRYLQTKRRKLGHLLEMVSG